MARIHVPHLGDNYFEVSSTLSAIISIQNVINEKQESIVADVVKDEVYDDDPEVNASMESQMLYYTEENVIRESSYSYVLLACSAIEKTIKLLNTDGLEKKTRNEGYGDYFRRTNIVPSMSIDTVNFLNDIFTLRHWIAHRNGKINIQKISEEERKLLERAGKNIETDNHYITIKHEYVDKMVKGIDAFLKQVAKAKYE